MRLYTIINNLLYFFAQRESGESLFFPQKVPTCRYYSAGRTYEYATAFRVGNERGEYCEKGHRHKRFTNHS